MPIIFTRKYPYADYYWSWNNQSPCTPLVNTNINRMSEFLITLLHIKMLTHSRGSVCYKMTSWRNLTCWFVNLIFIKRLVKIYAFKVWKSILCCCIELEKREVTISDTSLFIPVNHTRGFKFTGRVWTFCGILLQWNELPLSKYSFPAHLCGEFLMSSGNKITYI